MLPSPLRSLVIPLAITLVLGVPRFVRETSGEIGGWTGDYETSSTAPNPSEQFPSEATPDHARSLPAAEQDDPHEDGASDRPDSQISP
jgi:hypothetical protein